MQLLRVFILLLVQKNSDTPYTTKGFGWYYSSTITHHLNRGDFNINVLRKSKRLSELISITNGNDLLLQNGNQPTGKTKTSKKCIDQFFSIV